jgi:hypothetical protein
MSLVVHEPNEAIKAEIEQAVAPSCTGLRRRIVFAAAGNSGGNDPMPWPASLQSKWQGIIAIHATDELGTASNINPTVTDSAIATHGRLESFATLGRGTHSHTISICSSLYWKFLDPERITIARSLRRSKISCS